MEVKKAIINIKAIIDSRIKSVIFEGKQQNLKEEFSLETIFNEFELEYGTKNIKLQLNGKKMYNYNFEALPGINQAIIFGTHGKTIDLTFHYSIKPNIEIETNKKEGLEKIDISETKRIILINLSIDDYFYINGEDYVQYLYELSDKTSIQACIFDLDNKIVPYKVYYPDNHVLFFDTFKNKIDNINNLIEKFKEFLNNENRNKILLESQFNYLDDISDMKFNLPKNILLKYYNEKKYFDFLSNNCFLSIINDLLQNNIYINDFKSIYQFFFDYKNKLEKDDNLKYYMKSLVIIEFTYIFIYKKTNIEEFKKLKFNYFTKNNIDINSPLHNAISFLEEFIKDLDENSPFYYPLILIDSGRYNYNGKNIYGYGLNDKEIIKKHLNNIVPDVIITVEDINTSKTGETNRKSGIITMNLIKTLAPSELIDISKEINDENILIDYSLKITLNLFHEIMGHKKFGYQLKSKEESDSPNYFYDENKKKLMKLVNIRSNDEKPNVIKILRDKNFDGDSGHFIEYFFGECKYGYIIHLIEKMIIGKINLNLLFNKSLWKEKINILRNYVELKYLIFHERKELLDNLYNDNIEKEISILENIIKTHKIEFKFSNKKRIENYDPYEGIKTIKRKKKFVANIKENVENSEEEIDIEYYNNLSSEKIRKLLDDKEIPFKLFVLLQNIYQQKIRKQ